MATLIYINKRLAFEHRATMLYSLSYRTDVTDDKTDALH